jgi:protein-S-isoprenylcysteine O-methyltransferase
MWRAMIDGASLVAMGLWPALELYVALTRRARRGSVERAKGGGAGVVWAVAGPAAALALATRLVGLAPLPLPVSWSLPIAAALVTSGLALRLWAIRSLGAHFTVDVASGPGHRLVTRGPYARLRHPAYTGLLLGFLGLGVLSWDWVGLALAVAPTVVVVMRRISVEERMLRNRFGDEYGRYCACTSRLIPRVYKGLPG